MTSSISIDDFNKKFHIKDPVVPVTKAKTKAQANAIDILNKQTLAEKKSRLGCLLVQQYGKIYGDKKPHSKINEIIKISVRDFLETFDDIGEAEANLTLLEAQIRDLTFEAKSNANFGKESAKFDTSATLSTTTVNSASSGQSSKPGSRNSATPSPLEPNQWSVVNAILAVSEDDKQKKEKMLQNEKKMKFKRALDDQLAETARLREANDNEKARVRDAVIADVNSFNSSQDNLKKKLHDSHVAELQIRQKQIDENAQRKNYEKEARKRYEQMETERIRRELEEEQERSRKMKEDKRQMFERIKSENDRNREMKHEEMLKQREYDAQITREYQAKLDREESERRRAQQHRLETMQRHSSLIGGAVESKVREQNEQMEAQTRAAMEAKEKADQDREQQKLNKQRQELQKNREVNALILDKKSKEMQRQKEETQHFKELMEQDMMNLKAEEAQKLAIRQEKMGKAKQYLDRQVEERHQRQSQNKFSLSEKEMELNKSLIEKLNSNPEFYTKVSEKLHPSSVRSSNPKSK